MQVYPTTWILYTEHRYEWSAWEGGLSLSLVGLMAAFVQGFLTRKAIPVFGEKRTTLFGLAVSGTAFALYGIAPVGWLLYLIIVFGSLGGLATPAIQSLVSKPVPADEHGAVQGVLTSLNGLSGMFGPLLASGLFGFFTSTGTPIYIPGAAFFCSALLAVAAAILAFAALRNSPHRPLRSKIRIEPRGRKI